MRGTSIALIGLSGLLLLAGGASAQTGAPAIPSSQTLAEGFFGPGAGLSGVGPDVARSPVNTGGAAIGLFGPGGFFADARPLTSTSTPAGVQLVNAPATANGTANVSAPTTTKPKATLGGVGPRRFLGR
jgi:hypothetical protein